MALQSSGQIKLSEIATEFGGSEPHEMSEYYRDGSYVGSNNSSVPTSGEISVSDFYDAVAQQPFSSSTTYGSFYEVGQAMAVTSNTSLTQNISTNINSQNVGNWDYVIRSGETISSFSSGTYFSGTADTRGTFITWKGNLTINSGQTFKPSNRKLWTVMYVDGNLTLNGEISMTHRGANHSGTSAVDMRIIDGTYSSVSNPQVPATGGAGKSNATSNNASAGNTGTNGGTGAGGNGHNSDTPRTGTGGGASASGTSFGGGSGGGGVDGCTSNTAAASNGGRGGHSCGERAGGGAGNPGGNGGPLGGSSGGSGTGGVLIIFCTGSISGSGTLSAHGANGGTWSGHHRAGGGSGGGSITVVSSSNSFSGSIAANGGSAAGSGVGGAGTSRILTGL